MYQINLWQDASSGQNVECLSQSLHMRYQKKLICLEKNWNYFKHNLEVMQRIQNFGWENITVSCFPSFQSVKDSQIKVQPWNSGKNQGQGRHFDKINERIKMTCSRYFHFGKVTDKRHKNMVLLEKDILKSVVIKSRGEQMSLKNYGINCDVKS